MTLVATLAVVALVQTPGAAPSAPRPTVAILEVPTCTVRLRRAGALREESIEGGGVYLSPGDVVRCASRTGSVIIAAASVIRTITWKDSPYTVPAPRPDPQEIVKKQKMMATAVEEALRHHGRRAAPRGSIAPSKVTYPPAVGVVWLEQFVIRWRPKLAIGRVRASLRVADGSAEVWGDEKIDGRNGTLDSSSARDALGRILKEDPNLRPSFVMDFSDDSGVTSVPFRVLSPDAARSLELELAQWEAGGNRLLRLLGRAYSFDTRELFWEAAREYEAAFELTGSCDMLNEAIGANGRAGDDAQVRILTARRVSLPGGCLDRYGTR